MTDEQRYCRKCRSKQPALVEDSDDKLRHQCLTCMRWFNYQKPKVADKYRYEAHRFAACCSQLKDVSLNVQPFVVYLTCHSCEKTRKLERFDPHSRSRQLLDYDHVTPLILGGAPNGPKRLAHSRCNRSAGQYLSAKRRSLGIANHGRPRKRRQLPSW